MGSWGMTPFDSDNFGDAFAQVENDINKTLHAALTKSVANGKRHIRNYPNDAWSAVGLVIWAYHTGALHDEYNHLIDSALELVEMLRADEGFAGEHQYGDGRKVQMGPFLDKAEAMLNEMRGRHERPALIGVIADMFPSMPSPRRARRR